MNTKLKSVLRLTGDEIVKLVGCEKSVAKRQSKTAKIAVNEDCSLYVSSNPFAKGFSVQLQVGDRSYNIAGYMSADKKPNTDEIITLAENYIQNVILKTPVYTPPKYATKDAEIAALRNALTLIKSLSTPPNSLPWEASTQPHLPTLVDKIATIAKEAL